MKVVKLLLICVLLGFSYLSKSQQLEKLKEVHSPSDIRENIETYKKCYEYYIFKEPAKAHKCILNALELTVKIGDKNLEESLYSFIGNGYFQRGNYTLAIEYYKKSLGMLKQRSDTAGVMYALNDIGNCHFASGAYEKAQEFYREAISMGKNNSKFNVRDAMAVSLNNEGLVYAEQGLHYRALENHKLGFTYREPKNFASLAHSARSIGLDYVRLKVADSAEVYYRKAIKYCQLADDSMQMAAVWKAQSEMYATFDKSFKSDSTLRLAEKYFVNNNVYLQLAKTYVSLAELWFEKKNYSKCETYFFNAEEFAIKAKADALIGNAYEGLIKLYNATGQEGKSSKYYTKLIDLKDQLLMNQMRQAYENSTSQDEIYHLDKKIAEANLIQLETKSKLTLQESRNKTLQILLVLGTCIAVLLIAFIFYTLQQNNKLKKATKAAEEALKSKTEFFSNMSHEIRTPMNGIVGFTDLLLSERLPEKLREYVNGIKFAADNLMVIINDVLDLSKIESGKLNVERADFNLHNLLKEIGRNYKIQTKAKAIHFDMNVSPDVPVMIKGDSVRIFQVLGNLLNNAIKFTNEGTISFSITFNPEKKQLLFTVKDTGIGIEPEKQAYIFEKFTQAEANTSRIFGGSGLGLPIAKKMAEFMDGDITLKSELGKGSEFTFCLSNFESNAKAPEVATPIVLEKPRKEKNKVVVLPTSGKPKLLSVDDNSVNQKVVIMYLKNSGYDVGTASNGLEAIEKVEKNNYQVILMDFHMPEMDGFEATRKIRAMSDSAKSNAIIIGLTADVFENSRNLALEAGMNSILNKPIKKDELLSKVSEMTKSMGDSRLASA